MTLERNKEKGVLAFDKEDFYKNIYYFGYFIPKNVQNARYFAFFAQNIWQFQKNVLSLQYRKPKDFYQWMIAYAMSIRQRYKGRVGSIGILIKLHL